MVLVMGLAGAVVLLGGGPDESRTPATAEPGKHEEKSPGFGPPPWAQALGSAGNRSAGADWKDAWRTLTPAQREARMKALAKAHAEGMEKWRDCVTTAGSDRAERADCEKPVPPGLAKQGR